MASSTPKNTPRAEPKVAIWVWAIAFLIGLFFALYAISGLGLFYILFAIILYSVWAYSAPRVRGALMLLIDGFLVGLNGVLIPAIIRKILKSYDNWFEEATSKSVASKNQKE